MKSEVTLPVEAKENPIAFLERLMATVSEITDTHTIKRRLALIAAAQAWVKQYGKQAEPVLRQALVARLIHERRLGELLDGTIERGRPAKNVVPDDILPHGISRDLSMYAQTLAKVPRGWFDEVTRGILDGARRLAIKEIYLQARRMIAKSDGEIQLPEDLVIGDFREIGNQVVPDESTSLIFTDPPYDRRNIPIYQALAEFGSRVLLPGGSLLVYAPHYALPEILSAMTGKLRYFWTIAVVHKGNKALMREYGIRVWFKPLLWYVKGDRYNKQQIIRDVIESEPEKYEHEWQQSVVEARFAIEHLTEPGDLVVDPLAGSGTTLIAAEACNRRWFGIEQDTKTAKLATERLRRIEEKWLDSTY